MNEGWKVFWLFGTMFAATFGAEQAFVADVVPVPYADVPQPLWAVGTAVMLRALELMSGSIAFIAMILMCGVWAEHLRQAQGNARPELRAEAVPLDQQSPRRA